MTFQGVHTACAVHLGCTVFDTSPLSSKRTERQPRTEPRGGEARLVEPRLEGFLRACPPQEPRSSPLREDLLVTGGNGTHNNESLITRLFYRIASVWPDENEQWQFLLEMLITFPDNYTHWVPRT